MDHDGTGRRAAWDLFAERHVHMRSGGESRYVVLSRPLQIGVSAAVLAFLALLGVASYNAIAKHLALLAQERVVTEERALRAVQEHEAAQETASLRLRSEAAEREVDRLNAALEQAQAERAAAITASTQAASKAAELQAALAATMQESRKLAAELAATGAGGDARPDSGSNAASREQLLAEITGLRAELERVNREALALRRSATEARQALRALQGGEIQVLSQAGPGRAPGQPDPSGTAGPSRPEADAPAADEVRRLQRYLAEARASIASLSADLEALKGSGAGPASDAAVELATLEEQLGAAQQRALQLGLSLAAPPTEQRSDAAPPAAPLPSPPAPR
jgi:hypothetical protein